MIRCLTFVSKLPEELWRWYYWQVDKPEVRRGTSGSAGDSSQHRNRSDGSARPAGEYLQPARREHRISSAWVRASAKDEDKERINAGYEAVARDQAQVLAKVLREGTPLGREGILNALWDFHIRHYALPEMKADTVRSASRQFSPSM